MTENQQLLKLITEHVEWYKAHEQATWDKARRYYNGDFDVTSVVQGTKHLTSLNLVFSVAETAIASLLGSNPVFTAVPRSKKSIDKAPCAADIVNYVCDEVAIRFEAGLSLVDSALLGRAIFKTTWDGPKDQPDVKAQDPAGIFFDPTARRPRDITYWLQCTPLTVDKFKDRIKDKTYKRGAKIIPDRYPAILMTDDKKTRDANEMKKKANWVTVWEYYDMEKREVIHYVPKTDEIVLKEKLEYMPYSMYFLNHNGKDCRGLSEIQLILPQQDDINAILSQMKLIVLLSVPRILYNAGVIDEVEVEKIMDAMTGAFVGVKVNGQTQQPMAELFFSSPIPEVPDSMYNMLEKQEKTVSIVSALAEAARGQVTGAKTATEMALIDAQLRTRLTAREGNLAACLEDVADKILYLSSRYMKKPKLVEVSGGEYEELGIKQLKDVAVKFKLNLYNPLKSNPAVEAERFNALYENLVQDEAFDPMMLRKELVRLNGLRPDILKDDDGEEEITGEDVDTKAVQAAQEQAIMEQLTAMEQQQAQPQTPEAIQQQALQAAAQQAQGIPGAQGGF